MTLEFRYKLHTPVIALNDKNMFNIGIRSIISNLFQWKDRPPQTNIPDCFGNHPHADGEYVKFAMTVGLNDEEDIEKNGKHNFTREIICLCDTRGQTNYMEAKIQFDEDVLLKENNYNGIIAIKIGGGSIKNLSEDYFKSKWLIFKKTMYNQSKL